MAGPVVSVERRGAVLHLAVDRPEKRNALNAEVFAALSSVLEAHGGERELVAVVLTGRGERSFAAGGDLHELEKLRTREAIEGFTRGARAALAALRRFPLPVVAAINGDALGGGAELAMACDVRIAAAHARIGFLQGQLGIPTAWGGGIDLMRELGSARAMELLASSRILDAKEAHALGLVQAVADGPLDPFVEKWLGGWTSQRPQVMRAFKAQAIAQRFGAPYAERDAAETASFVDCWLHEDHWQATGRVLARLRG